MPVDETWTLGRAFEHTAKLHWKGSKSERSHFTNGAAALSFFGSDCPVSKVTTAEVDRWIEFLIERGASGGTINRKLSALSKMLHAAIRVTGKGTMPIISRRRENPGRIRVLSEDEEQRLVGHFLRNGDAVMARLVLVLLDTGLRMGEVRNLTLGDFSASKNTLTVTASKNGRPRTITGTRQVGMSLDMIKRSWSEPISKSTRFFPESYAYYQRRFDKAVKAIGLEDVTLHTLRHTCATRLVQRGVNLRVVMDWMGHSSINSTMRYAHSCQTDMAAAAKLLEKDV